ncbi:MAG: molecular chaperone SurA [Alphaproteobacteria bacterium]|nr:MAG: molecular chaperone SurA [Alphaproteobacteria bacterium]
MPRNDTIFAAFFLCALALAAGCTSSTEAVDTVRPTQAPAAVEEAAKPNIIRKEATVTQKGNYIVALVNGEPVTRYDVERRKKFRQLRRLGATEEATLAELVDDKLKLQEASRKGQRASDAQVETAFANFAKSNKSTPERIGRDLDGIGVGAAHFREFIRTQISWNRTVGAELQQETRERTQTSALFELRKTGAEKPQTTEYTLKQIVFVIPADKRGAQMKTRKAEAVAFQQRFEGCERAVDMAKQLRDVTVIDLGRIMLPELPPNWSEEVQKTPIDKATSPQETEKGVELLAVCNARVVSDDRAAQIVSQSHAFESLEKQGDAAADELLDKLRKAAVIVYK